MLLWTIAAAAGVVGVIEAVNHISGDSRMLVSQMLNSALPGSLSSFLFDV